MKSIVVFLVEHGETIDPLNQFTDETSDNGFNIPDLTVIDWTVRVDLADTDRDYTFRVMPPPAAMVMSLHSRDNNHVTFPGE